MSEHPELHIHLLRLCDRVSFNEIRNLKALHERRLDWAAADSVHVVEEGADVSELTEPRLDSLRQQYRTLHQGIEFYLVRRSVWICREPKAWAAVEYWLKDRHWRDGQGTDVFLCADARDADEVLSAEEIQAIEGPYAFQELARLDDGAEAETSPQ